MKCSKCRKRACLNGLCRKHFIEYFERKVIETIRKYKLLSKKDRIAVAFSGGKDSTVALYAVNKFFPNVTAVSIDEGISEGSYKRETGENSIDFCKKHRIKLKTYSFKEEFGLTLDEILKIVHEKPCSICGVLRRWLLNKKLSSFDRAATGHNSDDEAEAIFMNMTKANISTNARLGPITGVRSDKKFTIRVKPLYLCSEREIVEYANIMHFPVLKKRCPYRKEAFRLSIRKSIERIERKRKGAKEEFLKSHLKSLSKLREYFSEGDIMHCRECGQPSTKELCRACIILEKIRNAK
ncbi:MAG: TIGR00269 family protein [Candidatus Woesearchaeota archaeon]|nr:TIGR00269 family protein [Candidatus Woesearchaeota archaeon]